MYSEFPRIITFLRKEKKLSQKQAAAELGISQSLLSHYEKGIRECGLDFVVKAADYYNVSCDYLLGRTADRDYDLTDSGQFNESKKQSAAQIVNRRLIGSMLNIIYDYAAAGKNRRLERTLSSYIMLELYRLFRKLYSASGSSSQELFTVHEEVYSGYAGAAKEKCYADIESLTNPMSNSYLKAFESLGSSPEKIVEDYPDTAGEIFNVVRQAETIINKIKT